MINPNKCYADSGVFGLTFKGTAAQLAAVPDGLWTVAEGDIWYDTANDILMVYNGSWSPLGAVQAALTAEHGAGAIGTGVAPATYRRTENGIIITEIKIDLTGLSCGGTANDAIGLLATDACYIGRNVVATNGIIFKAELICVEVPAGGDTDINVVENTLADIQEDEAAGTDYGVDGGTMAAGIVVTNNACSQTANDYWYLASGGTTNDVYTAGQLIFRTHGHALLT
jgi:hypothetical protein